MVKSEPSVILAYHRRFLIWTVCDTSLSQTVFIWNRLWFAEIFERLRGRRNVLALSLYIIPTPALSSISLSLSPPHAELRRPPSIPRRGSARRRSRRGGGGTRRCSMSAAGGRLPEGTCISPKHTQFVGCLMILILFVPNAGAPPEVFGRLSLPTSLSRTRTTCKNSLWYAGEVQREAVLNQSKKPMSSSGAWRHRWFLASLTL